MCMVEPGRTVEACSLGVSLLLVVAAVLLAGAVTPAFAALGDEVAAGGAIARQLQAHATSCSKLSDADFEHLGEYVMERMVGSRVAHAAMNQRMASMMGSVAEERMHQLMGRRYADCGGAGAGAGGMMGALMRWRFGRRRGRGAMMRSSDLSWMRNGNWQHMNRSQWRDVQRAWMGNAMMNNRRHGWSVGGVLAVVFGALLLAGLVAFLAAAPPPEAAAAVHARSGVAARRSAPRLVGAISASNAGATTVSKGSRAGHGRGGASSRPSAPSWSPPAEQHQCGASL